MLNAIEIELTQGSDEWLSHRRKHYNASELAAAIGIHPNLSRNDLMRCYATGAEKEFSKYVEQVIFPNGHAAEARVRDRLEAELDEMLFPKCFAMGEYACSLDGQTILGNINVEIKQSNKELAELIRSSGCLPKDHYHYPQIQQGLWITGAEKCIFAVETEDQLGQVWCDVYPDLEFFEDIPRIWEKFKEDVANYTDLERVEFMAAGEKDLILPVAEINGGEIVLSSNVKTWFALKQAEFDSLPSEINADNAGQYKTIGENLKEASNALNIVIKALEGKAKPLNDHIKELKAISKTLSGNASFCADTLSEFRRSIRQAACDKAVIDFEEYLSATNESLTVPISMSTPDFMACCNRTKNHDSLANAIGAELAKAKIEVDKTADDYRTKSAWYQNAANGHFFLFSDLQQIIAKPLDDFKAVVENRIAQHKERIYAEQLAKRIKLDDALIIGGEQSTNQTTEKSDVQTTAPEQKGVFETENPVDNTNCLAYEPGSVQKHDVQSINAESDEAQSIQQPVTDGVEINNKSVQEAPSRNALTYAIAVKFDVSVTIAEQWLINAFKAG